MERRSKRLRTTPKPNYSVDLDSDADIPDAGPGSKKATKVKKKSVTKAGESHPKRALRGRRGKLEQISLLPLDILFEIFSQLDPIDILNLSRTSKPLRNILMRRTSLYVWKKARARFDGLPECPRDMSEPEYANLVFHPYCHFEGNYVENENKDLQTMHPPEVSQIFVASYSSKKPYKTFASFIRFPFDDDITEDMIFFNALADRVHDMFVNADTLRQYRAEKKDLKGSALDEWCASKRSEHEARKEHANRCETWNKDRNSERLNELESLREQRYQSIKERLSNLGWSEEIAHLEDTAWEYDELELSEHKLVKQPKVLTERIWNNIKDTLIDFLEGAKARRIVRSYRQTIKYRGDVLAKVLETYASSQPLYAILPSVADLAVLPAFRTVIEDTPLEEEISELHYQQAMVDFPQVVTEWRHSKYEALITMINDHPETQGKATLFTLEQAETFFFCRRCRKRLSSPRVLIHRCTTTLNYWSYGDIDEYFRNLNRQPWNHENSVIRYDHLTSKIARLILHDCQLNAETMTTDSLTELTNMGLRFECRLCKSRKEGRLVMKWPIVIDHVTSHHRVNATTDCTGIIQLADLTPAEKVLAGMLEYVRMSPASRAWFHNECWVCIECKKSIPWLDSLEHYKQKHPGVIPADYTDLDHKCHPDRYLAFHLDASPFLALCAPVKVNVRVPVHGFRDALSLYHRYSNEELDMMAQQMTAIFLAK